jgi:hypothetical protein
MALAAGLPGCGSATIVPPVSFMPRLSAISGVIDWIWMPFQPRVTWPLSFSCATTNLAVSERCPPEHQSPCRPSRRRARRSRC